MSIHFSKTFLLRKLHQITGIVPLGVFFLVHMYTNSTAMSGARIFNEHVQDIHNIPYLIFVETFGIFIPLLYHSIYGIIISGEARPNAVNYGFARNWFYLVQRITGVFLFFFLLFHILNFRFGMIPGLNTTPVAGHADQAFSIVEHEFQGDFIFFFYTLGILATAWHLATCASRAAPCFGPLVSRHRRSGVSWASNAIARGACRSSGTPYDAGL